jgi:hypothetical protein
LKRLFDEIRKIWVPAFPEEIIRQKLLKQMMGSLNYPKSFISVEKDLESLPHIEKKEFNANKRRLDIICFSKNIHPEFPLYPLLVIECKAHPITRKVVEQVVGYNYFVGAYFVCVANKDNIKTLWYDRKEEKYQSIDFLPTYNQLLEALNLSSES